jgi:hypothetical protein
MQAMLRSEHGGMNEVLAGVGAGRQAGRVFRTHAGSIAGGLYGLRLLR